MIDIIVAIIVSVFSCFCYDAIKTVVNERRNHKKSNSSIAYSVKYIKAIKKQFYICFPSGIIFIFFSNSQIEFIKIFNLVMSFFMFFLCPYGFYVCYRCNKSTYQ